MKATINVEHNGFKATFDLLREGDFNIVKVEIGHTEDEAYPTTKCVLRNMKKSVSEMVIELSRRMQANKRVVARSKEFYFLCAITNVFKALAESRQ